MEFQTSGTLAKRGKKGNLICKFGLVWEKLNWHVEDDFYGDNTVYELRECPEIEDMYVVWWEWTEEEIKEMKKDYGFTLNNFQVYKKEEVEEVFEDNNWKVLGNKCKRSIFKSN